MTHVVLVLLVDGLVVQVVSALCVQADEVHHGYAAAATEGAAATVPPSEAANSPEATSDVTPLRVPRNILSPLDDLQTAGQDGARPPASPTNPRVIVDFRLCHSCRELCQ